LKKTARREGLEPDVLLSIIEAKEEFDQRTAYDSLKNHLISSEMLDKAFQMIY